MTARAVSITSLTRRVYARPTTGIRPAPAKCFTRQRRSMAPAPLRPTPTTPLASLLNRRWDPVVTPSKPPPNGYTYDGSGFLTMLVDALGNTTYSCSDVDYAGTPIAGSRGNVTRQIAPPPSSGAS